VTLLFSLIWAVLALVLALAPFFARGVPMFGTIARINLNTLNATVNSRPRQRKRRTGLWATYFTLMNRRREPMNGFVLAAGGVAA
jgi:hypothetical protein